jgi:hypothetical protein
MVIQNLKGNKRDANMMHCRCARKGRYAKRARRRETKVINIFRVIIRTVWIFPYVKQIDEICQNIGFFIITGHLINEKIQNDMMKISKEFFHLPLSIKREISGSKDYPYGYNGLNDENLSLGYDNSSSSLLLSDLKESFSMDMNMNKKYAGHQNLFQCLRFG